MMSELRAMEARLAKSGNTTSSYETKSELTEMNNQVNTCLNVIHSGLVIIEYL